jgi:hypothetical protein
MAVNGGGIFICQHCHFSANIELLCKHIRNDHEGHANFSLLCNIELCYSKFSTVKCYYAHMVKFHKNLLIVPIDEAVNLANSMGFVNDSDSVENIQIDQEDCMNDIINFF